MISLTKIHGQKVYINENNIQWIEIEPDTLITFMNGTRLIVKESMDEIEKKIVEKIQQESMELVLLKNKNNYLDCDQTP